MPDPVCLLHSILTELKNKALKALALVRSGKEEEATELCAQVKASQPTDEPTLQAATMAYKEVGQRTCLAYNHC